MRFAVMFTVLWSISLLLIYAAGAFVALEANPVEWARSMREGAVIFAMSTGVMLSTAAWIQTGGKG